MLAQLIIGTMQYVTVRDVRPTVSESLHMHVCTTSAVALVAQLSRAEWIGGPGGRHDPYRARDAMRGSDVPGEQGFEGRRLDTTRHGTAREQIILRQ
jgi:hypothetical protein